MEKKDIQVALDILADSQYKINPHMILNLIK
jgi:hypothetical protein